MAIIQIYNLRKSYRVRKGKSRARAVEAVKGIDLEVEKGEIFGFLGPNGAGKTTTLKILATLLPPDSGNIAIAGHDLTSDPLAVRRRIGYVSQAGGTDTHATGRENLLLQGRLYGLNREEAEERTTKLIDTLDLGEIADRLAKTYSGGQRRKLDIALGMVHDPEILFLDEPTTGLDPVSRAQLWSKIRKLRAHGTTVFLTTHYLDEADALSDHIAVMNGGQIVATGTPRDLKRQVGGDVLTLAVNHAENAETLARESLEGLDFIRELHADAGHLRLVVANGGEALPVVMRTLETKGVGVVDIALSRPTLDDVFLKVTGHSIAEVEQATQGATR